MVDITVHVLRQIDVADSIDLTALSDVLRGLEPTRGAAVLRGPERAAGAGVILRNEPLDLRMGQRAVESFSTSVRLRVFDFGVIAVRFTLTSTASSPSSLVELASKLTATAGAFD